MLVPRSRPPIRDISSSLRLKSKTSRLCLTRSLRTDFGMTTTPRWIVHRRAIWATDLSCASAMPTSVGLVKKPFFPSAKAPQDSICSIWTSATAAAQLAHAVRFHDLRHAHASWLLAGGADIQTVKARLGHGSLRTTEKYLHTLPDTDNTALDALQRIRNRTSR